jgi:hypothetical protein
MLIMPESNFGRSCPDMSCYLDGLCYVKAVDEGPDSQIDPGEIGVHDRGDHPDHNYHKGLFKNP